MGHPFAALRDEYTSCLRAMKITRPQQVDETAKKLLRFVDEGRYAAVSKKTGVPQIVMAASFEREASSNFRLSPAQGDPWNRVSTHVPKGLGPYDSWADAAVVAYHIDRLDAVGAANWSWEMACYKEEEFNGFGPRNHGKHTGYLFAGTSIYTGGKYVADGVWSPTAYDSQLGVIPMMLRIVQLRPELALPFPFPGTDASASIPTPQAPPQGYHAAAALQAALNKLGADPQLDVDDNYGRFTRRAVEAFQKAHGLDVDGIAGTETWAAITKALGA